MSWSGDQKKVIYEVRGPDGRMYDIEAPEGTSDAQVIAAVQNQIRKEEREALKKQIDASWKNMYAGSEEVEESFWCKKMGFGCKAKKRQEKLAFCSKIAISLYKERLEEAYGDPSVWRLGGYDNAKDYAETSKRGSLSRCVK